MPDHSRIALVCCGLLGCLVTDEGLIERSYAEAIATQGVVSGTSAFARRMAQVHQARGRAPGDVLRLLFPDNEARALAARLAFDRALGDALRRFEVRPAPGVTDALVRLRGTGRQVCVLSGFPARILDAVLDDTGLRRHVDLTVTVDDVRRGFPAPDLVLTAILRTGTDAVTEVAVADATSAGVSAGHRAGAGFVAGLLTGPHASARLREAGADMVLRSFAALPDALDTARGAPGVPAQLASPGAEGGASGQAAAASGLATGAAPVVGCESGLVRDESGPVRGNAGSLRSDFGSAAGQAAAGPRHRTVRHQAAVRPGWPSSQHAANVPAQTPLHRGPATGPGSL